MWEYQINFNKGNTLKVELLLQTLVITLIFYRKVTQPLCMLAGKGDHAELKIPDDGNYVIWVFLMRNAARRDEHSKFTKILALSKAH